MVINWSRGDDQNRRHILDQGHSRTKANSSTKVRASVLGCFNLISSETAVRLFGLQPMSMGLSLEAARLKAMADRRCIWGLSGPREAACNQRDKAHGGARR
jgi:hypothetical protein